ncbi:Chitin-binding type-1 domain-containing protein [Abeliophyllum distichum]|uniref:Chitin-binding type-1 domain-containing protein n=1 Tax=Abeliophyllum distichum TaxID=126358 RepID=A0ABD1UK96_9LAMI
MADFNFSNQSQSSDSNSMNQTTAHMSNLAPFSMNLTQAASVKLDRDNFLLWKNVIMPIVRGHGLEGYLLGNKACPPQFINSQIIPEIETTMEMIPNPEYSR